MESNYLLDSEEPFGLTVFADPLLKGISLTNLTEEELDALERFWVTAFEMARPIVQLYDKQAADALADGSRKFWRMYRPPPIEYIRNEKPAIQKPKPDPEREE